jgi:NAD(P)-dependent dehydrogenase (short-subunit alcohol dehydrogenase family)
MNALKGKVSLVTGAGSGIGRATSVVFAREGAKVVLADIDPVGGEETLEMIAAQGGKAIFIEADVSNESQVEAMVKKAVRKYGRLDCAFNNAGIGGGEMIPTADYTAENWDKVLSVNLKGVWLCMKYEISQMLKEGGGAIVNMAAAGGLVGMEGLCAYIASKSGVIGLTKTAALEYARDGIRINAVCPGVVRTPNLERLPGAEALMAPLQPMGRVGAPEEIAGAVVWLCSDWATYVTGHPLVVDGGTLAQGWRWIWQQGAPNITAADLQQGE